MSDSMSRAQALHELVYFSGLTSRELEIAARALSPVEVAQGEVIFTQGEEGAWLYLLSRGAVEVSIETGASGVDEAGNNLGRRVLARLGPPALLGEMSVLLDERRSAWAHATEPCLLWQVSREEVRQALEANQKWAQRLLLAMSKILAARLAEMNRKLAVLTTQESRSLDPDDLAALQQALFLAE